MGDRTGDARTRVERGERELTVTRMFDAPVRLVFEAWAKPELFQLWWVPKSNPMELVSCEMDIRTGGGYRLAFGREGKEVMAFFGKYLEVTPPSRIVWTNDEGAQGAVTTVTFAEVDGKTRLVMHELYPSKEALDESFEGMEDSAPEQFGQLDALLKTLAAKV